MTISTITSYYDGCEFNSKLELLWAVYFKKCGTSYKYRSLYEHLYDYCPDFYVVSKDCFIEVTYRRNDSNVNLDRKMQFVAKTKKELISIFGDPLSNLNNIVQSISFVNSEIVFNDVRFEINKYAAKYAREQIKTLRSEEELCKIRLKTQEKQRLKEEQEAKKLFDREKRFSSSMKLIQEGKKVQKEKELDHLRMLIELGEKK